MGEGGKKEDRSLEKGRVFDMGDEFEVSLSENTTPLSCPPSRLGCIYDPSVKSASVATQVEPSHPSERD